MASFVWNDNELSVGNSLIDDDHREIIAQMNELFAAMAHGKGKDVLAQLLSAVVGSASAHFVREEDEMFRIQYLELSSHREEHERLSRELLDMQRKFIAGKSMLSIQASRYLNDWVFNHVLHEDKELAAAIARFDHR